MIDWNNNGKIDPEEIFLSEEILGEAEKAEQHPKHSGCLLSLLTLPIFILKGFHI